MREKRIPEIILSAATVLLSANLIVQTVMIYLRGTAPDNLTASGVLIHDIYSPQIIREAFQRSGMKWMLLVWLGCLVFVLIRRIRCRAPGERGAGDMTCRRKTDPEKRKKQFQAMRREVSAMQAAEEKAGLYRKLRWILLIAGVVLVFAGIANGGMRDVLVKAANICTECIGLG